MIKPVIAVIAYNRTDSLIRLLNSIKHAKYPVDDISLIISIDKSDKEEDILRIADNFSWEYGSKIIRTHEERIGLKKHILENGSLSLQYGAVIILEDDLFVARDFYNFVYQAVNYYADDKRVAGIALYSHEWNGYAASPFVHRIGNADVFAGQFSITWGQCWTAERWRDFSEWFSKHDVYQFNTKIPHRINRWSDQSWGKYFVNYIVEKRLYYIIPNFSLSTNFSEVGQHSSYVNADHQVRLWECVDKEYKFQQLDELYKYDIFFEPVFEGEINGIKVEQIEIDLNMTQRRISEKRYRLSTKKCDYLILKEYGLELRPIENNILYDIPGKGIYLYDTSKKKKNCYTSKIDKLLYDIRGYRFTQLLPLAWNNFKVVISVKSGLLIKKLQRKIYLR